MTVAELKRELEAFVQGLHQHQQAWLNSQGWPLTVIKRQALEAQANQLARRLGRLRPYILQFLPLPNWIMSVQATGTRWDALDAAVGNDVAPIKGPSLKAALGKLHQVLGKLDGLSPQLELGPPITPKIPAQPPPQTTPLSSLASQKDADPPVPPSVGQAGRPSAQPPITFERLTVRALFAGLMNLSLGAFLSLLGILGTLVGATVAVTRWNDQRSIDTARDSLRMQQQVLNAEHARAESLAAVLRGKAKHP